MKPQEAITVLKSSLEMARHNKDVFEKTFPSQKSNYSIDIEVYEMAISALEKQIPKKPKHIHKEYDKHDWHKKSDGTVNEDYWEYECHSGVQCKRCGETVCTLCHEDYDEYAEECVIDKYLCPVCKKTVYKDVYCKCGQKLDWSDTE